MAKHAAICSVARAEALGKREFRLGKKRVPALSKRVSAAFKHCPAPKTKNVLRYLTAWLRGWDKENLR